MKAKFSVITINGAPLANGQDVLAGFTIFNVVAPPQFATYRIPASGPRQFALVNAGGGILEYFTTCGQARDESTTKTTGSLIFRNLIHGWAKTIRLQYERGYAKPLPGIDDVSVSATVRVDF